MINDSTFLLFEIIQMFLSHISNDILEYIFEFLSEKDKLNLIKTDKN